MCHLILFIQFERSLLFCYLFILAGVRQPITVAEVSLFDFCDGEMSFTIFCHVAISDDDWFLLLRVPHKFHWFFRFFADRVLICNIPWSRAGGRLNFGTELRKVRDFSHLLVLLETQSQNGRSEC